jgi:hypothetical protein
VADLDDKLLEKHRLASLLLEVVNKCEICASKLKNGFVNLQDYHRTAKTIERLQNEIKGIDLGVIENLDEGEKNEA